MSVNQMARQQLVQVEVHGSDDLTAVVEQLTAVDQLWVYAAALSGIQPEEYGPWSVRRALWPRRPEDENEARRQAILYLLSQEVPVEGIAEILNMAVRAVEGAVGRLSMEGVVVATMSGAYGVVPGAVQGSDRRLPRPTVVRLSKSSPLLIELGFGELVGGGAAGGAGGLLVFLLRNPSRIGAFLGEGLRAWHSSMGAAEQARHRRRLQNTLAGEWFRRYEADAIDDEELNELVSEHARNLGDQVLGMSPEVLRVDGIEEFREGRLDQ